MLCLTLVVAPTGCIPDLGLVFGYEFLLKSGFVTDMCNAASNQAKHNVNNIH
jgi:hypothetical protein